MVSFIGNCSGKVDDKGRVVFPAVFKAAMSGEADQTLDTAADMRLVVRKDIYTDCLEIYTYSEWEQQAAAIRESLDIVFNREHAAFWRKYMSGCAVVEPDGKLGRISIPKELLETIGVIKEVVFAGVGYKIELWARERREAGLISDQQYEQTAVELSSSRKR